MKYSGIFSLLLPLKQSTMIYLQLTVHTVQQMPQIAQHGLQIYSYTCHAFTEVMVLLLIYSLFF